MFDASFSSSRRQLFRQLTNRSGAPLRPPWSVAEVDFTDHCTRCGDCIQQCPESILIKGSGGFPELDFQRGECTFCQECVHSCRAPVFIDTQLPAWSHKAQISDQCITHNQVVCRSCAEQCDPEAIRIRPQSGGIGTPQLDLERCTGCGACVSVCPSQAIKVGTCPDPSSQSPVNSQQQS